MGENYAWPLKKCVHNDLMAYYSNYKENKGWKKHRNESKGILFSILIIT